MVVSTGEVVVVFSVGIVVCGVGFFGELNNLRFFVFVTSDLFVISMTSWLLLVVVVVMVLSVVVSILVLDGGDSVRCFFVFMPHKCVSML